MGKFIGAIKQGLKVPKTRKRPISKKLVRKFKTVQQRNFGVSSPLMEGLGLKKKKRR